MVIAYLFPNSKKQCCIFVSVSDNNNANTKEDAVTPGMNPEDRPDLQDYMSKEQPSQRAGNSSNSCKYCNKTFSTMEQLTAHYRKEHPESF
jgi:uncharacterized Zn-finger protein